MASASPERDSPLPAPPGVSGKRVTGVVVAGLLIVGVTLSYALWTYNRLEAARSVSAAQWRGVAEQLSLRYRGVEKAIAAGVDERRVKMEFGESFRLAVDAFRTTALPEPQRAAAERIEALLDSPELAPLAGQLPPVAPAAQQAVVEYNLAQATEKRLLESWGGRLLNIFFRFPEPRPFELAAAAVAN